MKLDITIDVLLWLAVFASLMGLGVPWITSFTFANVAATFAVLIQTHR